MARLRTGGKGSRPEQRTDFARLWAPWRATYISAAARSGPRRCIFCVGRLSQSGQRRHLILYAGSQGLVMLNRYPYNAGHLMVAPRRHVASPELLAREEQLALTELLTEAVKQVRSALSPAGFNLGANLGRIAGAGFDQHLHWHIVPRWEGDTNFMSVLATTRVISQHLEQTYRLLAPLFKGIAATLS